MLLKSLIGTEINDDIFTERMSSFEFMRFIEFKKQMALRVTNMMIAISVPSDIDMKKLYRMPLESLTCLHDDLVCVSGMPYASRAFVERVAQTDNLAMQEAYS